MKKRILAALGTATVLALAGCGKMEDRSDSSEDMGSISTETRPAITTAVTTQSSAEKTTTTTAGTTSAAVTTTSAETMTETTVTTTTAATTAAKASATATKAVTAAATAAPVADEQPEPVYYDPPAEQVYYEQPYYEQPYYEQPYYEEPAYEPQTTEEQNVEQEPEESTGEPENTEQPQENNENSENGESSGNGDEPEEQQPENVTSTGAVIEVIDGRTYIDGLLIVNKTYSLPSSYAPGLDWQAQQAFNEMQQAARWDGISLWICSGYRSYWYQNDLYWSYARWDGQWNADRYSARPGHSEHQSGLAMDINNASRSFVGTREAYWLADHCADYGFIIRYPEGKEWATGFMYEPWHLRYVGKEWARTITDSGLCLEEYFGITSSYS